MKDSKDFIMDEKEMDYIDDIDDEEQYDSLSDAEIHEPFDPKKVDVIAQTMVMNTMRIAVLSG